MSSRSQLFPGSHKRKRSASVGTSRKKARTLAARVSKIEATIEHKSIDFAAKADATSPTVYFKPTGQVTVLNEISAGDDLSNREGRRAMVESCFMRYHIRLRSADLAEYRHMLVWDKYANGAKATAEEILDFSGVIDGEEAMAPLNLENRDRFNVLYDDTNGVGHPSLDRQGYGTASAGEAQDVQQKAYVKVGKVSTWGGISNVPTTGALLLVTLGNTWTSPTAAPTQNFVGVYRTRFTDA